MGKLVRRETLDIRLLTDSIGGYGTDYDWTLPQAVEWLQGLLDQVPPEFRDRSYFIIDSESDYEGGYNTTLRIGYQREETEVEATERVAAWEAEGNAQLAREREMYEALKWKFEGR